MANKLAVIGCGGIGSFFLQLLRQYIDYGQFPGWYLNEVVIYDFDIVDRSNLFHQNFSVNDLSASKVWAIIEKHQSDTYTGDDNNRSGYSGAPRKFTETDLPEFPMYAICADNPGVRHLVYTHCLETGKPFVDMRCEGSEYMVVNHTAGERFLMASLGEHKESEEGRSCQTVADQAIGRVQPGNFIVAGEGMQYLLKIAREEGYNKGFRGTAAGERYIIQ